MIIVNLIKFQFFIYFFKSCWITPITPVKCFVHHTMHEYSHFHLCAPSWHSNPDVSISLQEILNRGSRSSDRVTEACISWRVTFTTCMTLISHAKAICKYVGATAIGESRMHLAGAFRSLDVRVRNAHRDHRACTRMAVVAVI